MSLKSVFTTLCFAGAAIAFSIAAQDNARTNEYGNGGLFSAATLVAIYAARKSSFQTPKP